MTCSQCDATNSDDARFCSNCGTELPRDMQGVRPHKTRDCFNCGYGNSTEDRYCAKCGVELGRHQPRPHDKHHHQQPPKRKGKRVDPRIKWHPASVVLLIIGGAIAYLSIPYITGNPPGRNSQPARLAEIRSDDPVVEAKVREVSAKFICSCGTCGEQPLDICTCNTAIQERQFIRNAFQSGKTSEQIIVAVDTTFGWMKPEFVARYDSLALKTVPISRVPVAKKGLSTQFMVPPPTQNSMLTFSQAQTRDSSVATVFSREEILSHFRCPCGQCGIDELRDCSCDHPRGANEIKAFVDQKIAENKYTVGQLIDQLDKTYGGRRF